jgi:hypothetical protein
METKKPVNMQDEVVIYTKENTEKPPVSSSEPTVNQCGVLIYVVPDKTTVKPSVIKAELHIPSTIPIEQSSIPLSMPNCTPVDRQLNSTPTCEIHAMPDIATTNENKQRHRSVILLRMESQLLNNIPVRQAYVVGIAVFVIVAICSQQLTLVFVLHDNGGQYPYDVFHVLCFSEFVNIGISVWLNWLVLRQANVCTMLRHHLPTYWKPVLLYSVGFIVVQISVRYALYYITIDIFVIASISKLALTTGVVFLFGNARGYTHRHVTASIQTVAILALVLSTRVGALHDHTALLIGLMWTLLHCMCVAYGLVLYHDFTARLPWPWLTTEIPIRVTLFILLTIGVLSTSDVRALRPTDVLYALIDVRWWLMCMTQIIYVWCVNGGTQYLNAYGLQCSVTVSSMIMYTVGKTRTGGISPKDILALVVIFLQLYNTLGIQKRGDNS